MDFSISEEQQMLADSVTRFIDQQYDFDTRQQVAASDAGFSAQTWGEFVEMGWTAVPFGEDDGGLGGGPVELMLMFEQFGRGLVVEPYLASIVMAGGVLKRLAGAEQKSRWLAPLLEGNIATLAFTEPQSRYRLHDVQLTATADGDRYLLNGRKSVVLAGDLAETLVVSARTSGQATDESGISLFVLDPGGEGIERQGYATVDGHRAADFELTAAAVPADQLLGPEGEGLSTLREVIDEATFAVCAEAVGIMQTLHEKTLEYTKSRVQFGRPIAGFQALQHRMVDTFMLCEQTRSLLLWAAMTSADEDADAAAQAVSTLKYQVGSAGRKVGEEAVQLHGGMGVTWELDVAHYFKRLTAINMLFGNADHHLDRLVV